MELIPMYLRFYTHKYYTPTHIFEEREIDRERRKKRKKRKQRGTK